VAIRTYLADELVACLEFLCDTGDSVSSYCQEIFPKNLEIVAFRVPASRRLKDSVSSYCQEIFPKNLEIVAFRENDPER
jgi:hypothetical protein